MMYFITLFFTQLNEIFGKYCYESFQTVIRFDFFLQNKINSKILHCFIKSFDYNINISVLI